MSVTRTRRVRARRTSKPRASAPSVITSVATALVDAASTSDVRASRHALTEQELFGVSPPQWEIENRMEQGGFNVVIGPRGIYKTFFVAALLLALTVKRATWFESQVLRRGPVMMVPLEDLRGWRLRWEAARIALGVDAREHLPIFTWSHSLNFYTGEGVEDLAREADHLGVIHLVIDPWADAISGADENSQKDVGLALSRLKRLRRNDRSVTVVCHTGHDQSRERGSTVLGAAADTMMLLRRDRDESAVVVDCTKMRNGDRFAPMHLQFDREALVLRPVSVSLIRELPKQQGLVLQALQTLGPVEIRKWRERCQQVEGVPRRTFFAAKAALIKSGLVEELNGGLFVA